MPPTGVTRSPTGGLQVDSPEKLGPKGLTGPLEYPVFLSRV